MNLTAYKGDITKDTSVDCIVNAANRVMLGGGGVDGAIHAAAGPGLLAEIKELYEEDRDGNRCPLGGARLTGGHNLVAPYIIHTVGPDCRLDGTDELEARRRAALASAYRTTIELAMSKGMTTIAFPAISTGIYGFPVWEATEIAITTIIATIPRSYRMARINFACYDFRTLHVYTSLLPLITAYHNTINTRVGDVKDHSWSIHN